MSVSPVSCMLLLLVSGATAAQIERIDADKSTGSSRAAIVDDLPLVHTRQILPFENDRPVAGNDARGQTEAVLHRLEEILRRTQSNLKDVVKLNVYLKNDALRSAAEQAMAVQFHDLGPAVTFVVSEAAEPGVAVTADAVALCRNSEEKAGFGTFLRQGVADCAVLPVGPKIFISGMADTNELVTATRRTLQKLMAAAAHLAVDTQDVVELKAFLQPISRADEVRSEIVTFFRGKAPPISFVEWISAAPNPPIEIELIAAGKPGVTNDHSSVSFLTPSGTISTRLFSRVARVNRGKLIYWSGLYGGATLSGTEQVTGLFHSLKPLLEKTGTDFEHLVKATYYVSDEEAGNALNVVRPKFFNPDRPPAASKAKLRSVAFPDHSICVDLIAVTR